MWYETAFVFLFCFLFVYIETKRLYGDVCDGDYYCNETLNLICPTVAGRK